VLRLHVWAVQTSSPSLHRREAAWEEAQLYFGSSPLQPVIFKASVHSANTWRGRLLETGGLGGQNSLLPPALKRQRRK
jgi:hypothetical protein